MIKEINIKLNDRILNINLLNKDDRINKIYQQVSDLDEFELEHFNGNCIRLKEVNIEIGLYKVSNRIIIVPIYADLSKYDKIISLKLYDNSLISLDEFIRIVHITYECIQAKKFRVYSIDRGIEVREDTEGILIQFD